MAELPDTDPRLLGALKVLVGQVQHIARRGLSGPVLDEIEEHIATFRMGFRSHHGADFPEMVIFYLPSVPFLILYRRDLDTDQVRIKMHDLIRFLQQTHRNIHAIEIAAAIKRCWPSYDAPIESLRRDPKILRPVH